MGPPDPGTKPALRRTLGRLRRGLHPDGRQLAATRATQALLALPELAAPCRVCCFVSYRAEIETRPLLQGLLAAGHTVAVPRVQGARMEARRLTSMAHLVPGAFGIPTSEGPVLPQVDVVVVPGLGFTPEGDRLGYGAGHYDRWLATQHAAFTAAFAYQAQVVQGLPTQAHDRSMACVVTEAGVHRGPPARALRVVAGAVIRAGTVLATRRGPSMAHAGFWELPGGKVEAGEDDTAALIRELHEELGIRVAVNQELARTTHPYPGARVTLVARRATLVHGEPTLTEHDALRWLPLNALDQVPWAPADLPLLAAVASEG